MATTEDESRVVLTERRPKRRQNVPRTYRPICRCFCVECFKENIKALMEYVMMSRITVTIGTILLVTALSFLLPDVSQRVRATKELSSIKNVLTWITNQVSVAESDCLQLTDSVCSIKSHHNLHQDDDIDSGRSICSCIKFDSDDNDSDNRIVGFLQNVIRGPKNVSHKELTIMTYTYSNNKADDKTLHKDVISETDSDIIPSNV